MLPLLPSTTTTTTTIALFLLSLLSPPPSSATITTLNHHHHRRHLLHQPFFPIHPPSPSPLSPPNSTTTTTTPSKHPFSSSSSPTTTTTTTTTSSPFFPIFPTPPPQPPPPPPPSTTAIPTFPANISSLALPTTSSSSPSSHSLSPKLLITLIILSFFALSLIASLSTLLLLRRRHRHRKSHHSLSTSSSDDGGDDRLYPPNAPTSDGRHPPKLPVSNTSSEFHYLGTMATSREFVQPQTTIVEHPSEIYIKLCGSGNESPELKPLPPLPKRSFHHVSFEHDTEIQAQERGGEDEEFYSPAASNTTLKSDRCYGLRSSHSSFRGSSYLSSPENVDSDSDVSVEIQELLAEAAAHKAATPPMAPPPPPPPPLPARSWASSGSGSGSGTGPPAHIPPSGPIVFHRRSGTFGEKKSSGEMNKLMMKSEELVGNGKTKLKALHWDKVRASSDRVMVWDQLQPGSFQLNEEMIETLFKANGPSVGGKDGARRSIMPLLNEETRVLDPKKSQNVAILLRALNVTVEEVCEALVEGNADALGTELLESLLKMAPTKEEEKTLKEYNDVTPLKLGPAEKFLKIVLDVPFAFKRVDAMLYMATFDSEVEYLRKSFETLEASCEELRNSRMFLKLLEAVLKTGNRMNVGTYRGDAQAFKLDTLLKLVDIKGTDGKTTLLHFVVQEIIKAEGSRLSHKNQQHTLHDDIESRKQGLEVVAGLGGELTNVKKAAGMDSNTLSTDVAKLARGITKVNEVLQLNGASGRRETNTTFSESMIRFLNKAECELVRLQSQESNAFSRVKELTEYFHGNLAKEEAHPLRIFMVVRDFLSVLDQVCKEVGKINERTIISSARPFTVSVNSTQPPPFPAFTGGHRDSSSSDDESLVLT